MEKLNLTQQKHTFTNKKKCTTTQNKHKKTKVRFSRLLWHLAWKRRGPILVSVLHKFVTYLLTYTTYPLIYSPGIHTRQNYGAWEDIITVANFHALWKSPTINISRTPWHFLTMLQLLTSCTYYCQCYQ